MSITTGDPTSRSVDVREVEYTCKISRPVFMTGQGRGAQFKWVTVEVPRAVGVGDEEFAALCQQAVADTLAMDEMIGQAFPGGFAADAGGVLAALQAFATGGQGALPAQAGRSWSGNNGGQRWNGNGGGGGNMQGPVTEKQIALVLRLFSRAEWDLEATCKQQFNVEPQGLTKAQASALIDQAKRHLGEGE